MTHHKNGASQEAPFEFKSYRSLFTLPFLGDEDRLPA